MIQSAMLLADETVKSMSGSEIWAMILGLLGGLGLFLLGMNFMGEGLENACGSKMKKILEKATANRFIGVAVGMIVTMIIQSSSATTVMVVGFVNAGLMNLTQAVWIIMGANIGTTITGQIVALDVDWLGPVAAFLGVAIMLFIKKPTIREVGKIFAGFGVLFIGMGMMGDSMKELSKLEDFQNFMTSFDNPFLAIIAGLVFTAVIQSSSASVGILQTMAGNGLITFGSSVYILFGQNIGTCVTSLIASVGTSRAAKRTTMVHFLFNIIGTIIFTTACLIITAINKNGIDEIMSNIATDSKTQIAHMHTFFNITTTVLLIPFGTLLVKLVEKILPDRKSDEPQIFMYIDKDMDLRVGGAALYLDSIKNEVSRMYQITFDSITESFDALLDDSKRKSTLVVQNEDLVDKLNEGITKHITEAMANEANFEVSQAYSAYLNITHNIERISDHAMNIFEYALELSEKNVTLNEEVKAEVLEMKNVCIEMLNISLEHNRLNDVSAYETKTDDMTKAFKENMVNRLKGSICTADGSLIYSNVLINFERIGDHLLNINEYVNQIQND